MGLSSSHGPVEWSLGTISVWFKEGVEQAVNNGSDPAFAMAPEILSQFDAPRAETSPVLPVVVCVLMMVAFLQFARSMVALGANADLLTGRGVALSLNIVTLLALTVAFWLGVLNLVQTMWVLAFYGPLSLFVLKTGLASVEGIH